MIISRDMLTSDWSTEGTEPGVPCSVPWTSLGRCLPISRGPACLLNPESLPSINGWPEKWTHITRPDWKERKGLWVISMISKTKSWQAVYKWKSMGKEVIYKCVLQAKALLITLFRPHSLYSMITDHNAGWQCLVEDQKKNRRKKSWKVNF